MRKGVPMKFLRGHNNFRHTGPRHLEEDLGYDTPCWVWQYGRYPNGYAQIIIDRKPKLAHRYLYEEKYGRLGKDVHLHHLCERPICVRPDHLQPLSPAAHARLRKTTKLTLRDAVRMRELYATGGYSYRTLGEEFGVAPMTAYYAVNWGWE